MTRQIDNRRGYTLIEILLVMAIILILSSVATITLRGAFGDMRLKGAADDVKASLIETRGLAVEQGRPYAFMVQPGTGQYRIAPYVSEMGADEPTDESVQDVIREDQISDGLSFDVQDAIGAEQDGWTVIAVFEFDGSSLGDRRITLSSSETNFPYIITIRGLTGAVNVVREDGLR